MKALTRVPCAILFLSSVLFAQSGGTFAVARSVIPAGGGRASGGAYGVEGTIAQPIAGTTSTGGALALISGFWDAGTTVPPVRAPFDFDGDGKTDIGIFRPGPAEWWVNRSSTGVTFAAQFGNATDRIVPGDFTGDAKADIAVWRPATQVRRVARDSRRIGRAKNV